MWKKKIISSAGEDDVTSSVWICGQIVCISILKYSFVDDKNAAVESICVCSKQSENNKIKSSTETSFDIIGLVISAKSVLLLLGDSVWNSL